MHCTRCCRHRLEHLAVIQAEVELLRQPVPSRLRQALQLHRRAADSVSAVAGTSAADQLNAAASAVSAAAGTGDALQGDAGTISAGLDSASSAIDILNSIDTSSMDEATAAAVNSALRVQSVQSPAVWLPHREVWQTWKHMPDRFLV